MSNPDKKRRRQAKRTAKQQQLRRQKSISPLKRLADAPGPIECWASEDFDFHGQMQIFVYKRAAGLTGIACFLIDRGVVGLKDAWTRLHIDRAGFDEVLASCRTGGFTMRRIDLADVRNWVAGAVRFAHDNGMRLPRDWTRTASLLGGVGDWTTADVSRFVMEFAGHPEDLRQRLIGQPFESYLQRTDIQFTFSDDAPYMDQATGEYVDDEDDEDFDDDEDAQVPGGVAERIESLARRIAPATMTLADQTRAWLATQQQPASPELPEAWTCIILASALTSVAVPDPDSPAAAKLSTALLDELPLRNDPSRQPEISRAINQVLDHLDTDPTLIQTALDTHGFTNHPDAPPPPSAC